MDLLTQLDSDIDLLLKIMSSSISFISRKAKHQPLPSSTIPLTILGKTEAIEPAEMDAAISELVSDLVEKAQSIREIILHLPTADSLGGEQELQFDLTAMQDEIKKANVEYRQAVEEVKVLQEELTRLLEVVCDEARSGRAWLVKQLESKRDEAMKETESETQRLIAS